MPSYIWIPAEIKTFRKFLKLSQWLFAVAIDYTLCPDVVIRNWESGRTKRISERYQKLLNKLASKTGYNPVTQTNRIRKCHTR